MRYSEYIGLNGDMSGKLLDVLEAVALYGPATLDQLYGKLCRTRSSVYRALVQLEQSRWIRRSINGRSFTISGKMEKLSEIRYNTSDDIDEILINLQRLIKGRRCAVTVLAHVKGGDFEIIDSNRFPLPQSVSCNDRKEIFSRVVGVVRHRTTRDVSENRLDLLDAQIIDYASDVGTNGFLVSPDFEMSVTPVLMLSGELVLIILENTDYSVSSLNDILQITRDLLEILAMLNVSLVHRDVQSKLVAE